MRNLYIYPHWRVSDAFCTSKDVPNHVLIPLIDFLAELVSALYNTSVLLEWKKFGIFLKLSVESLLVIGLNQPWSVHLRLVETLELWLRSAIDPPPSLITVIEAIQFLGMHQVADKLSAKFLPGVNVVP